jgi:PadR family transcriptional regulator, regulatory protein AphA
MCGVSLRAAILGFLELDPTTGYSLKQRFEGSVGSFWSVTQSQIYRELHALEREGKVVAKREAGDGAPDRKVYALTSAGREELQAWLRAPLEPLQLRHPLLLKFVFASEVPPAELDAVLEGYETSLAATRAEYQGRLKAKEIFSLARSKREAAMWRLSIEHGLAWCDTELDWLRKTRRTLSKGAGRGAR